MLSLEICHARGPSFEGCAGRNNLVCNYDSRYTGGFIIRSMVCLLIQKKTFSLSSSYMYMKVQHNKKKGILYIATYESSSVHMANVPVVHGEVYISVLYRMDRHDTNRSSIGLPANFPPLPNLTF